MQSVAMVMRYEAGRSRTLEYAKIFAHTDLCRSELLAAVFWRCFADGV